MTRDLEAHECSLRQHDRAHLARHRRETARPLPRVVARALDDLEGARLDGLRCQEHAWRETVPVEEKGHEVETPSRRGSPTRSRPSLPSQPAGPSPLPDFTSRSATRSSFLNAHALPVSPLVAIDSPLLIRDASRFKT